VGEKGISGGSPLKGDRKEKRGEQSVIWLSCPPCRKKVKRGKEKENLRDASIRGGLRWKRGIENGKNGNILAGTDSVCRIVICIERKGRLKMGGHPNKKKNGENPGWL